MMEVCAENIALARAGRPVLAGLNFRLLPGGMLVLHGPNGSGKSSVLRLLAGLLPPAEGCLYATLASAERLGTEELGKFTHYCGHLDALKASLTVDETLSYFHAVSACPAMNPFLPVRNGKFLPSAVLAEFGLERLTLSDPVKFLSAGQRRRLSLCRLLLRSRPLWLLDEPMAQLDEEACRLLLTHIARHRATGGLVVMAGHDLSHAGDAERLDIGALSFLKTQAWRRQERYPR
jgi:heme exporter protein A